VLLDVVVALGDVFSLNVDPLPPPIGIVFAVVSDEFETILRGEEILAVCQLMNNVFRVAHNYDNLLCLKALRLTVHRVVGLCEPDAIFGVRVQFAEVATPDCFVEGMIDVGIGSDKNPCDLFK